MPIFRSDCVQSLEFDVQFSDPSQDLRRRTDTGGLCDPPLQLCQLDGERGESCTKQNSTFLCTELGKKLRSKVKTAPSPQLIALESLNVETLLAPRLHMWTTLPAGVGHVWRVLLQPPRPASHPHRLRVRRSPVQEGLSPQWLR